MPATSTLPREFRLAVACCSWPASERRHTTIRAIADDSIDWDLFLRVVERQRVAGLAHDGLVRASVPLPDDTAERLKSSAVITARNSLMLASEAIRLQTLFEEAGVTAVFLKGTTLAILAYDNIAVKQAWDIDLLVPREVVREACKILHDAGYERVLPPARFSDRQFGVWTELAHESVFRHKAHASIVELHWSLTANPAPISGIAIASGIRGIEVLPGQCLKTLGDDDLFSYLCLHGAHHGWARLKWLSDLAAWLNQKPCQEIERLYRDAKRKGAGRAPDQALLLCEQLFDLALPTELAERMKKDRINHWLVAIAMNAMAGGGATQEIGDRKFGNLQIELSQFLLADSPRVWVQSLRSKSVGLTDYLNLPLPRPLLFLYPLLRAPLWLGRRAAQLVKWAPPISRASGP